MSDHRHALPHLADHAPVTENAIEQQEEAAWSLARLHADGVIFDGPNCQTTLQLRHQGATSEAK